MPGREEELAAQDRRDARRRKGSMEQTRTEVTRMIENAEGLLRLEGITDEEWAAAEAEDAEGAI